MLKEIEPQLTRAAFVANPKTTPYDYFLRAAEAAAPSLAIELVPVRVQTATDIERSIEVFGRVPNGRLVGPPQKNPPGRSATHLRPLAKRRLWDGGMVSKLSKRFDFKWSRKWVRVI